jgi:queuine tRNA-ribosyltransferase
MSSPSTPGFGFRVLGRQGAARAGLLTTPHGEVPTPTFMPVGTQGSVKALSPSEVAGTGARVVLGNTYHLWIRPGPQVVASLGGLHGFTRWPHAMLTDSGGFQAFSLAPLTRQTEDGFVFRSHLDGRRMSLTPEEAMRVQGLIGADIAMQLDVCPPALADRAVVSRAVEQTSRWAERCLRCKRADQALFGIVQGATFVDLRRQHARSLGDMAFDGLALGGFSVGEPNESMHDVLGQVASELDPDRPRYLMGVGTPADLVRAVGAGVDMFDCVMPTRNARNGQALLRTGRIVVKNARYASDSRPIDPECGCPCCAGGFSRGYLRHLYMAREILALRLLSVHNLHLYGAIMRELREAILNGTYQHYAHEFLSAAAAGRVAAGPLEDN